MIKIIHDQSTNHFNTAQFPLCVMCCLNEWMELIYIHHREAKSPSNQPATCPISGSIQFIWRYGDI